MEPFKDMVEANDYWHRYFQQHPNNQMGPKSMLVWMKGGIRRVTKDAFGCLYGDFVFYGPVQPQ